MGFRTGAYPQDGVPLVESRHRLFEGVRRLPELHAAAGVKFFFKQWGEWHPDALLCTAPDGSCPPKNMRVGKKRAGRLLDGREWNEVPT
jgi:protein gp37